jgi:hypothetical protein
MRSGRARGEATAHRQPWGKFVTFAASCLIQVRTRGRRGDAHAATAMPAPRTRSPHADARRMTQRRAAAACAHLPRPGVRGAVVLVFGLRARRQGAAGADAGGDRHRRQRGCVGGRGGRRRGAVGSAGRPHGAPLPCAAGQPFLVALLHAVNLGGYFAILSGSIYDATKDNPTLGPRWAGAPTQWDIVKGRAVRSHAAARPRRWHSRARRPRRQPPPTARAAVLPARRLVIGLGSLCCLCGYFGLWLLVSGKAEGGFAELLLFAICAGAWVAGGSVLLCPCNSAAACVATPPTSTPRSSRASFRPPRQPAPAPAARAPRQRGHVV